MKLYQIFKNDECTEIADGMTPFEYFLSYKSAIKYMQNNCCGFKIKEFTLNDAKHPVIVSALGKRFSISPLHVNDYFNEVGNVAGIYSLLEKDVTLPVKSPVFFSTRWFMRMGYQYEESKEIALEACDRLIEETGMGPQAVELAKLGYRV